MDLNPIALQGRYVRLEPLRPDHAQGMFIALAMDPTIWQWRPVEPPATLAGMEALVAAQLEVQARGNILPFAQVAQASGRVVGATAYLGISHPDRAVEIGATWLGRPWQRTGINTEAKYLLLEHAFEVLGTVRVQFRTDLRNLVSQRAIEGLGAVREGVFRQHMRTRGGIFRDSVFYSIVAEEWPAVKAQLRARMAFHEGQLAG
ncbi:MAG: GNAT family N-acetyltransferase [Planctomycetes bacterium]|nr:GNAT family N-acetyltransferase [Planctomycetota bacterium]